MTQLYLTQEDLQLQKKIVYTLEQQGFVFDKQLKTMRPAEESKEHYREIQRRAKLEQLQHLPSRRDFICRLYPTVMNYCRDGSDINPENIKLKLLEVKSGTKENDLFLWWNIVWWNMPYQQAYGRQMRFMLWDTTHDAPFGLFLLQSPVLLMAVRDKWLGLKYRRNDNEDDLTYLMNTSMYAQRAGALPPYNQLLGGKMVSVALTCNELREMYRKKYDGKVTKMEERVIDPNLLFITTTSAFGKSSTYDRLKINGNEIVAQSLGYTKGTGTFHIPNDIYREMTRFLVNKNVMVKKDKNGKSILANDYGDGPSTKMKVITQASKLLQLPKLTTHTIKREFYLFPLVKNLMDVIHHDVQPDWVDRPFNMLVNYWKQRWAIPRAQRMPQWRGFKASQIHEQLINDIPQLADQLPKKSFENLLKYIVVT